MKARPIAVLLVLATAVTGLNGLKPLTADDTVYYSYAAHIARQPLDPYGFLVCEAVPAHHVLAPLGLPYWLAGAVRIGGERPWVCKLSLWPFSVMLVLALYALFRRFARGLEMPLVGLMACSPAFLPGWNLMLDLPALALGLVAVVLYLRADERSSGRLALLAGLVAGLAMQTKYTAFVVPGVLLLHGLLAGRPRRGLTAALLAGLVFAGWEGCITRAYGESHLLYHLHDRPATVRGKIHLLLPLFVTLGGVFSCGALLGLTALGVRPRRVLAAGGALGMGYLLLALVPGRWQNIAGAAGQGRALALGGVFFALSGALLCGTVLAASGRLCRPARRADGGPVPGRGNAVEWFLVSWLLLEVAGYFALSPFPAVRRVLGVVVVATLLAGRLLARGGLSADRLRLVWGTVAANALLGLGFFAVDCWDARAGRMAAEEAVRWIRRQEPRAGVWYLGAHGFAFYAERAGMKHLPPDRAVPPGDWLVTDQLCADGAAVRFPFTAPRRLLAVQDRLPLRTYPCYYGSGTPLEHQDGPRFVARIYRQDPPAAVPGPLAWRTNGSRR